MMINRRAIVGLLATVVLSGCAGSGSETGSPIEQAAQAGGRAPTAQQINVKMADGFNLGNTFDLAIHPPKADAIKPLIDLYQREGMRHVRIPVTWMDGFGGDHLADEDGKLKANHPRLKELEGVVDYALQKGLVVMLNTHHEHWLKKGWDGSASMRNRFSNLWTGIANRFKDRSPNLIFEVLNEPEGAFGDWSGSIKPGDAGALARTREINQIGYDAIRATGGANTTRVIAVAPNGQGNQSQLDDVYPERASLPGGGRDPYLMASVHTYDPWDFCGQEGKMSARPSLEAIRKPIQAVSAHAKKLSVPVNYGEYGVGRNGRQEERNSDAVREYYRTVRETTKQEGMSNTPWDDRGWFGLTKPAGTGFEFVFNIVPTMLKD